MIEIEVGSLEVKLFYKTQRELATTVNKVVDAYWEDKIEEKDLINNIHNLYVNNPSKMMKEEDFTTVIKQQCGKRRLEVVDRIINIQQEKQ